MRQAHNFDFVLSYRILCGVNGANIGSPFKEWFTKTAWLWSFNGMVIGLLVNLHQIATKLNLPPSILHVIICSIYIASRKIIMLRANRDCVFIVFVII